MILSNGYKRSCPVVVLVTAALMTCGFPDPLFADPPSSPHPPVFQPGETQHGFSEFDTLPTFPEDSPQSRPDKEAHPFSPTPPNIDQPPTGVFHTIEFAEGYEEAQGLRRSHQLVPVRPTDTFPPNTRAVFVVFTVHKHYAPYQVFGRLYPEHVDGLDPIRMLDEDTMYLELEDESGFLQFFPPNGQWRPGAYRVEIYIGFEINPVNRMGTMRFRVVPHASDP